jgi:lipid-A-disaccharide synthase
MTADDGTAAMTQSVLSGDFHPPHVLVIAGEASGDRHAARLIEAIHHRRPDVNFFGIGGERMREQGTHLLFDASQMNVIGFIEVVKRYRFFRSVFRETVALARLHAPSFAILVDYPGFNLRLAQKLRSLRIPVVYYIAPQVWAWKEGRVDTLRRYVDDLIVVFPFEVEYFARHRIKAHFFGHPLVDQFAADRPRKRSTRRKDERPTIAYLPGSRPEELQRHMPVICKVIRMMGTGYRHLIPLAPTLDRSMLKKFSSLADFRIVDDAHDALRAADAALVKSGTSTVEAALLGVPFAVIYKTSNLSYQIAKRAIKVSSIGMVNLLAGRKIVREFVQSEVEASRLVEELHRLLEDTVYRETMRSGLRKVASDLGDPGAASRAAEYIIDRYL